MDTLLGDAVFIVDQLEDLLNKENELILALMKQRNALFIIRDQNFDLIDYLYLNLSNEKGFLFFFINCNIVFRSFSNTDECKTNRKKRKFTIESSSSCKRYKFNHKSH